MKKIVNIGMKALVGASFATAAALIIAPATLASSAKNHALLKDTSNATTYGYEPLSIASGYNAPVIATSSTETSATGWKNVQGVDDNNYRTNSAEITESPTDYNNANLFTVSGKPSGKSGTGLPDPVDGFITLTSQHTPTSSTNNLTWKIPASLTESTNNCMKLFVNTDEATKTGKFTFNEFGVYNKLYVLCTLAGSGVKSAQVEIKLNYTTGSATTATYTIYDWFPSDSEWTTMSNNNLIATTAYTRFWFYYSGGQVTNWNSGSGSKETVFNQCAVNVDPTRIPTDLQITLKSTNKGDTLCCYGVTGQYASDVSAPVTIKTQKTKEDGTYHNYVTWADDTTGSTPSYYYLDVYYYDESGNVVWSNYNNTEITRAEAVAANFKWEILNLETNKVYYVKMRSGNASKIQSANSNIDYIYTDVGCPIKITCEVYDSTSNKKDFDIKVNEPTYLKTVVINDQDPQSPCGDQGVIWTIPDKYKDSITITEDSQSVLGEYKIWKVVSTKPFKMSATEMLIANAHADLDQEDEVQGNTKPNPVVPAASVIANKQATISWNNPDIGSTKSTDNKFNLIVTESATGTEKFNGTVDYKSGSKTSKDITGLSPKTKYKVKAQTVYTDSTSENTNAESITSDWSSEVEFETSYNAANSLSLSKSSISLMLGSTDTTASLTTTVKDSSSNNATFQDVTWTGDTQYATVTSGTVAQETPTTHTFKPVKATSTAQTWTATVNEKTSLTSSVSVTVGVSPTTVSEATSIKPDSFTANWSEAKRTNGSYWGDGYVITLYDSSVKVVDTITINDPSQTSYTFKNLTHGATYSYSVKVLNNNVSSAESTRKIVKTETSLPTILEVYNGETKVASDYWFHVLVGSETTLTTKVIGETFDGTYYVADDQKVPYANNAKGFVSVTDSSDKTTHVIKGVTEGTDAFDLQTNSNPRDKTEPLYQTIKVQVEAMQLPTIYNIGSDKFDVSWTNLSQYADDPSKLTYTIEASTDGSPTITKTFSAGTTECEFTELQAKTSYNVKAKYTYNGVDSAYTQVQTITTDDAITSFTLAPTSMTIIGNNFSTELVASINASSSMTVEYELSDKTICKVEPIAYVAENGLSNYRFKVTGLNTGKTTMTVWPTGYKTSEFSKTCEITVVKGELDPITPWVNNVTSNSFQLNWKGIKDWLDNDVNYKVNVWSIGQDGEKQFAVKDFVTSDTHLLLNESRNIKTNKTYYCTVDAFNDKFQTNANNIVEVTLTTVFPWWKVWTIIGGTIGGLLIGPAALYVLWKNDIIKTMNPKKAKLKLASGKNNIFDKGFRVMDMYYVMWNQIVRKRFDTLFTKLGTKKEQKIAKDESKPSKK